MSPRRRTNENGVDKEDSPQQVATTEQEQNKRRTRKLRRPEVTRYQKQLYCIRWSIVVVVLLLIALAVTYYYTRIYEPLDGVSERETSGSRGVKKDGENNKKKVNSNSKSQEAGEKIKNKKNTKTDKTSTGKKGKKSSKKSTKRGTEIPTIPMEEVRLLRRPVAPGDADRPYIIEILNGDNLLLEERFSEGLEKFNEVLKMFPQSPRGLYGKGETLTGLARQKSSNKLLDTAIEFYQDTADSFLAPHDLKVAALARLAELCQERGKNAAVITALEKLHDLDSEDTIIANRLGAAYVKMNKLQKAEEHFRKLLNEMPDNYYAKAHLGYLRYREKRYEEALPMLLEGINNDVNIKKNGRFYLYAGEILTSLNRSDEALVLYGEGVGRDVFPSLYQRSLFNEAGLRAMAWWDVEETGYQQQLQHILNHIDNITSEVMPVLLGGDFQSPPTVLLLYAHGKKNAENCRKLPFTCSLLDSFPEATSCKHGDVKLLVVPPKSHIPPHTGQTNTHLVVTVGLNLGDGELKIRSAEETRTLRDREVIVYDDSFEQELWYSSLRPGLVLSMDVWHPDLSSERKKRLVSIL